MTISDVRKLFPHLQTDQIYFNHAALSPWSTIATDRINFYIKQRTGELIDNYSSYVKWSGSAKEKLGNLLGVEPERIAWVDNVSNGLNILAQGLKWNSGDRIVLNDMEFPSNVYPFLNLKKQGVEVDIVKSRNGVVEIEDFEKVLTPKTRLLSISLVQFLSGYRADIDEIGNLCKKHGITFCVDVIQGAGAVRFDAKRSKVDFLSGGTQKWLMSSQGLSYIYLTEELQSRIDQKNVGWTSVKNAWSLLEYDLTLRKGADSFQTGTVNRIGVAIFDAVLNLFIEFGIENIEQRVLNNTNYFIDKLLNIGVDPILKGVSAKNYSGIVSFKHNNAKQIFDELENRKIFGAVREGMIRFSPHFYNTEEEITKVSDELEIILKGLK